MMAKWWVSRELRMLHPDRCYTQLLLCLIMSDLCLVQHFLLLFDFEHIVGGQSVGSVDDKLSCGVPYWAWRCGLSLCGVLYALSTEAQVKL
mmetsp:Transcript_35704/g.52383  ORF Transcript_35704/g.52383 Transcript_35704/m.52383 type:complete len:91 (+) Transcript_35704:77-349(+)